MEKFPVTMGSLSINQTLADKYKLGTLCKFGNYILDDRDLSTGNKNASDAAFTLAKHFLAFLLNYSAGSYMMPEMADVINRANTLLTCVGYNGTKAYGIRSGNPSYSYALLLAKIFDAYNNSGESGNQAYVLSLIAQLKSVTVPKCGPAVNTGGKTVNATETESVPIDLTEPKINVYPNPFANVVTFELEMTYDSPVKIEIFSNSGVPLGVKLEENLLTGDIRRVQFDASRYLHTTFIYKVTTNHKIFSGTILRVK